MKLLTKPILRATPALYANEELPADQVPIRAKFFTPWGSWTWYMTEYDPETGRAFGFVTSHMCPEGELGYFMIPELAELRGSWGLTIERDMYFEGRTLADVMAGKPVAR